MEGAGVTVSNEDVQNKILAEFAKRDLELRNIFTVLVAFVTSMPAEQSPSEGLRLQNTRNLQSILSMEFLIIKARILLTDELIILRSVGTDPGLSTYAKTQFKIRENQINVYNTKLTEIREDFNTIQKLAYTTNINLNQN